MANATTPVAPTPPATRFEVVLNFLRRYRIAMSLVFFTAIVGYDFVTGRKPHNLLNPGDIYAMLGVALTLLGVALRSWAAGTLTKWNQLTTVGPYRLIRNPLYVGSFLMMVGFCVLIGNLLNLVIIVLPMAIIYGVKVRNEEQTLGEKFGDTWTKYARATPRFIPRRLPFGAGGQWTFSQWMQNREYNAAAATVAGLAALQLWHAGFLAFSF